MADAQPRGAPAEKKHRTEAAPAAQQAPTVDPAAMAARPGTVLAALREYDAGRLGMFQKPVTEEEAPGYGKVIDDPMDLGTMATKLRGGTYDSDSAFTDDVALMIGNALRFNVSGSDWHRHAKKVGKKAAELFVTHGVKGSLAALGFGTADAGEDGLYVPTKRAEDKDKGFIRDEEKINEDMTSTLAAMKQDLGMSLEELRAKYRPAKAAVDEDADESDDSDEGSEEDSDESDEESEAGDSGDDDEA